MFVAAMRKANAVTTRTDRIYFMQRKKNQPTALMASYFTSFLCVFPLLAGCLSAPPVPSTATPLAGRPGLAQPLQPTEPTAVDSQYLGQTRNNHPNGIGTMRHSSNDLYSGIWQQGVKQHQGMLTFPEAKSVYLGSFTDNKRSGFGRFIDKISEYSGQWHNDLPQGYGLFQLSNGRNFYAGFWNQGVRWGSGFSIDEIGGYYLGNWQQGLPTGFGESITPQGNWFQGFWQAGRREGYGRSLSPTGTSYEGTYKQGKKHGFGVEVRIDGTRYEGEWQQDLRSGYGVATIGNGNQHEGEWRDGLPVGIGSRSFSGGYRITGEWQGNYIPEGKVSLADRPDILYEGRLQLARTTKDRTIIIRASTALLGWLEKIAETGSYAAQNLLTQAYAWNQESATNNKDNILHWLKKAAPRSPSAAFRLALFHLSEADASRDQTSNKSQAIALLQQAAARAHTGALLMLGNLHYTGLHLDRNDTLAQVHYLNAARAGNITARNNFSWILATSTNQSLRNGRRALILMRPIVHSYPSPQYLDTLGAVYAELGNFTAAQTTQHRALELAKKQNSPAIEQMQSRLARYRQDQAWRE